jgi:hypothetical protein
MPFWKACFWLCCANTSHSALLLYGQGIEKEKTTKIE